MIGKGQVPIENGSEIKTLRLVVAKGDKPNLLGREWLEKVKLN